MSYSAGMPVDYDVSGSVATITLNEPQRRNALSPALLGDLSRHLDTAAADTGVRTVVLSHTGNTFCSGMDLTAVTDKAASDQPIAAFPEVLQRIWEYDKPVVARVDGKARAGGIGLIAAADLALASPQADFAFTEVRLGLVPAVISVPALYRVQSRALLELCLSGELFTAERAAEIGLLNTVTERLDFDVARYAAMFELGEPKALAATKRMLRRDRTGIDMATDFAAMGELSAGYFASPEAAEGIAAFREKRRPYWAD